MKKTSLLLLLLAGFSYITLTSNVAGLTIDRTGATAVTGCGGSGCHTTGTTAGVAVSIVLDSAGTIVYHYRPGMTYRVKVRAVNATPDSLPVYGYQLSAFSGSTGSGAVQAGTFTDLPTHGALSTISSLSILGSTSAASVSGTGTSGSLDTFSLFWTAPAAGAGTVNMYAVVCACNGDGLEGTEDKWNKGSNSFAELPPPNGVAEVNRGNSWALYPNPATTVLTLKYTGNVADVSNIALFDISGKEVLSAKQQLSNNQLQLNVAGYPAGIYSLVITGYDGIAIKTVVLQ